MHVTVIIPALDEELSIGAVLDSLKGSLVRSVIVADNGSSDRTAQIAAARGALVVREPERGYGAACAAAVKHLPAETSIVVFMDADGADDPADLARLIEPVEAGEKDLVIGARRHIDAGALTPQQRIGNRIATTLIRLLYGFRYTDLGPFRAVRRSTLDRMNMRDRRYGWTVEMQIRALQIGARAGEVDVHYRRRAGRSKISGTVSGVLKAGFWILYTVFAHAIAWPARRRSARWSGVAR
ncbi:MAG TPA: glycosyltransferase family 2 protein [Thermoanaerobaculia bacterium]|nr:glycosyltransferase family 2 protein [Thermoanaerobaculia bacterium]